MLTLSYLIQKEHTISFHSPESIRSFLIEKKQTFFRHLYHRTSDVHEVYGSYEPITYHVEELKSGTGFVISFYGQYSLRPIEQIVVTHDHDSFFTKFDVKAYLPNLLACCLSGIHITEDELRSFSELNKLPFENDATITYGIDVLSEPDMLSGFLSETKNHSFKVHYHTFPKDQLKTIWRFDAEKHEEFLSQLIHRNKTHSYTIEIFHNPYLACFLLSKEFSVSHRKLAR